MPSRGSSTFRPLSGRRRLPIRPLPMDFQLLNEQDGLVGTPAQYKPTPSAIMDNLGVLWFATSGHLVSLDPSQVKVSTSAPNVLLQSVLVNWRGHHAPAGRAPRGRVAPA